jgi:hypothetical protein
MSATARDSIRQFPSQPAQRPSTRRSKRRRPATQTHERSHAMTRSVVLLLGVPLFGQSPSTRVRSLPPRSPAGLYPFRSVVRQARPWVAQGPEAPTTSRLGCCTRRPWGTTQPPWPSPSRRATRPRELAPRMDQGDASTGDRPAGRTEPACPAAPCCKPRSHRRKSAQLTLGRAPEATVANV